MQEEGEEVEEEEEEEEEGDEWTQEDFAVDPNDLNLTWTYYASSESTISNAAQFAGWSWVMPLW